MDVLENEDKFPTNWVAPEGYRNKGITTNRVVSAVTSFQPRSWVDEIRIDKYCYAIK